MKTRPVAIALVAASTLIIATAQILYKIGSKSLSADPISLLTNYPIILGLFLYMIGAFMITWAFKKGELSILFPVIALSYVWVCLFAQAWLHEQMNGMRWLGISSIIAGVSFIGFGNERAQEPAAPSALPGEGEESLQ